MSNHHGKGLPNCLNCHTSLSELDRFCPNCGQQNTDGHVSLHDLWHELTHYFTHVDNKIFVTIKDLLIPGKLTDEFFKGHRKRYIHPINLFFVVGIIMPFILGQIWHKTATENFMDKGYIKEKELYRNDLLFEMDSMMKHDSSRFAGSVRPVLDSFLLENYQRNNTKWSAVDTSEKGYMIQYYRIMDKMQDARKAVRILTDTLQIDKNFVDKPLMQKRLEETEAFLSKLKYDSIATITKSAATYNKSYKEIEEKWANGMLGYSYGKSMASKSKPKPLTIDDVMRYPVGYDVLQVRLDSIRRIIKRDSTDLGLFAGTDLKIDELDLSVMSYGALIDKYQVTGWRPKMAVKQAKKFGQQGMEGIMKSYNEKSTWLTILGIIPAAWFLLLMYRSRNRLYVEHLVFLLHFSTLSFVISALLLIQKGWMIYFSLFVTFTALTFAMKRFYKQGWGKTLLKSAIFYTLNTILGLILATFGILLNLLFF
jgi:Protein of unknown function (DUF3667)